MPRAALSNVSYVRLLGRSYHPEKRFLFCLLDAVAVVRGGPCPLAMRSAAPSCTAAVRPKRGTGWASRAAYPYLPRVPRPSGYPLNTPNPPPSVSFCISFCKHGAVSILANSANMHTQKVLDLVGCACQRKPWRVPASHPRPPRPRRARVGCGVQWFRRRRQNGPSKRTSCSIGGSGLPKHRGRLSRRRLRRPPQSSGVVRE